MRPEEIVRRLPALDLADVYAVIAYALRHPEEMENYLRNAREMEERARAELDAIHPDRQDPRPPRRDAAGAAGVLNAPVPLDAGGRGRFPLSRE